MSRFGLMAVLAGCVLLTPAFAQEKSTLKWKFEKDKSFFQKMTTTTKQNMKVGDNEVKQDQSQTFYFSWTPVKQDGDTWELKQKIEGVTMSIDIGGNKISYDSTKDTGEAANPLSEFFKALKGSEFVVMNSFARWLFPTPKCSLCLTKSSMNKLSRTWLNRLLVLSPATK
jgi:hypothetical protein